MRERYRMRERDRLRDRREIGCVRERDRVIGIEKQRTVRTMIIKIGERERERERERDWKCRKVIRKND